MIELKSTGIGAVLEESGIVIPAGSTLLICPSNADHFIPPEAKFQMEAEFAAIGIRAIVLLFPVKVWAVENERS